MEGNILKLSFLMSYLTMLICVVSGIPFMTALFRSILLLTLFSLAGFALRWYLLKMVEGIEPDRPAHFGEPESYDQVFEGGEASPPEREERLDNVEHNQPGT
ncbi:MAG: hypothetical protein V1794_04255 [Candidatus Glassbacteria bacterium]